LGDGKVTERMRIAVPVSIVMGKIITMTVTVVMVTDVEVDQQTEM